MAEQILLVGVLPLRPVAGWSLRRALAAQAQSGVCRPARLPRITPADAKVRPPSPCGLRMRYVARMELAPIEERALARVSKGASIIRGDRSRITLAFHAGY